MGTNEALADEEAEAECFVCRMGAGGSAGPLVTNVCDCLGLQMHLGCQKRMIETCTRGRLTRKSVDERLLCGICKAPYRNARIQYRWQFSSSAAIFICVAFFECSFLALVYLRPRWCEARGEEPPRWREEGAVVNFPIADRSIAAPPH